MSKELSEFLRTEVDRRGISQRELSRQAGLSAMTVNSIIMNPDSQPDVKTCINLAKALEIPEKIMLELAGYTEIASSTPLEKQVAALAIYLNSLPERVQGYALDACWAITKIMADALEELDD